MKSCLVTGCTALFQPLADITIPTKAEYSQRHGYDFKVERFDQIHYASQCLSVLRTLATGKYDRVMWSGADTMVTNMRNPLPHRGSAPLMICSDAHGLNLDVFICDNHPASLELLHNVAASRHLFGTSLWVEQDAMMHFANAGNLCYLPQRTMNSYEYELYKSLGHPYDRAVDSFGNDGNWQPGDFVLHVPALPLEVRRQVLSDHVPLIVR